MRDINHLRRPRRVQAGQNPCAAHFLPAYNPPFVRLRPRSGFLCASAVITPAPPEKNPICRKFPELCGNRGFFKPRKPSFGCPFLPSCFPYYTGPLPFFMMSKNNTLPRDLPQTQITKQSSPMVATSCATNLSQLTLKSSSSANKISHTSISWPGRASTSPAPPAFASTPLSPFPSVQVSGSTPGSPPAPRHFHPPS